MLKMRQGHSLQTSYCFLEKDMRLKQVVSTLVTIYLGSLQLQNTMKINCVNIETVDQLISPILIFQKRVWDQFFQNILCMDFQKRAFGLPQIVSDLKVDL